ncbi:MAG: 2Fe-2S iron-sulfur cluster-binding protein, partial [Planctomycetota bacterium]
MGEPSVNIDGNELIGQTGQSVLELALANDIEIPNLCHDPRLNPSGSCRLCVVEVEGQNGPVCACTLQIQPEMIVRTQTQEIRAIRKTLLELLFYEHRGACTTCDENGDCKLQRYAYEYQLDDDIFQPPARGERRENYTTGNEALEYDTDKCIRCGRCIRICEEVQADSALTFKSRAASIEVTTAFDIPLND